MATTSRIIPDGLLASTGRPLPELVQRQPVEREPSEESGGCGGRIARLLGYLDEHNLGRVRIVRAGCWDRTGKWLRVDDWIDGGELLPGFRCQVRDFFKDLMDFEGSSFHADLRIPLRPLRPQLRDLGPRPRRRGPLSKMRRDRPGETPQRPGRRAERWTEGLVAASL
jgi:hypothetical protein